MVAAAKAAAEAEAAQQAEEERVARKATGVARTAEEEHQRKEAASTAEEAIRLAGAAWETEKAEQSAWLKLSVWQARNLGRLQQTEWLRKQTTTTTKSNQEGRRTVSCL